MKFNKWKILRYLRASHRDIGFIVVGLCLIYGISGIIVNHRDGNPSYRVVTTEIQFHSNLDAESLLQEWHKRGDLPEVKRSMEIDEIQRQINFEGGRAVYNRQTGVLQYNEMHQKPIAHAVNKLHYNRVRGWTIVGDIFAGALIFLAISGLFLVRGNRGLIGRGKWFLLAGLVVPLVYIFI